MKKIMVALAAAALLGGCAAAATENGENTQPAPDQPPPPATETLLPRGTQIVVVLGDTLDAERTSVGDRFTATVHTPITTATGREVIPAGTVLTGLVTGVDDSDHDRDTAYVRLNFVRMTLGEANHPFAAEIVSTSAAPAGTNVPDAEKSSAVGAVTGAVIGAVIGGDLRSAIEGAGMGGGAGTIISLGTERTVLPAGTVMVIRTTANISLEE